MRWATIWGTCLLVSIVFGATSVRAQRSGVTWLNEDLMVEEIGVDIWRHVSYHELQNFGRVPANGLIVVSEGVAALIDTPWTDEQTQRLMDWVSRSLKARVESVIATHSHGDCMGGLAAAHELGVTSYAGELTADRAKAKGLPVPQNTFVDSATVKVGLLDLELRYFGPGHTIDNIVVWVRERRVLFGGCLVRSMASASLGYTAEADLSSWPKTIEALLLRFSSAETIVPGHGKPGGTELLTHTLRLLGTQ